MHTMCGVAESLQDLVAPFSEEQPDEQLLSRFLEHDDQSAFELLVRRHAPMIMGVCRRLLRNEHAAEDALQAVFVVLLRKAASIRRPELLANWLYGVAFRVARKARSRSSREHASYVSADVAAELDPQSAPEHREFTSVLDEELRQLPAKYRLPLIICYLDGKTHLEAARVLGCPSGSVADRLARARAELRRRLLRRGLVLSAGLLLSLLKNSRASAEISAQSIARLLALAAGGMPLAPRPGDRAGAADFRELSEERGPTPEFADELPPDAADDATARSKWRRTRRIWLALFWLSLLSWLVIPVYELAGSTVVWNWTGALPRGWSEIRAAVFVRSDMPLGAGRDDLSFENGEQGADRVAASHRRRLSAEEVRCKRCLGTQCGTKPAQERTPRAISLWKRLFSRG